MLTLSLTDQLPDLRKLRKLVELFKANKLEFSQLLPYDALVCVISNCLSEWSDKDSDHRQMASRQCESSYDSEDWLKWQCNSCSRYTETSWHQQRHHSCSCSWLSWRHRGYTSHHREHHRGWLSWGHLGYTRNHRTHHRGISHDSSAPRWPTLPVGGGPALKTLVQTNAL